MNLKLVACLIGIVIFLYKVILEDFPIRLY